MNSFLDALEMAIETENWYSALFLTLTLPDICGKIYEPNANSSKRYINWYNNYLLEEYTIRIEVGHIKREAPLITGKDFYALRCAVLHAGSDTLTEQFIQETLEKVNFTIPHTNGTRIHKTRVQNVLYIQVDQLAKEMINAVRLWINHIASDSIKIQKLENMVTIKMYSLF
jgi:hypothetical protein